MILKRARPRLGVVVPVYNVGAMLAPCLDSILGQTYRNLQIVVVDDGSTDGSGDVADEYAARDRRITVVHTRNRGLGAARNEGLRHVDSELVTFADSDDVVPARAYATLVGSLRRTGSDLVGGSILRWEGDQLSEPRWMKRIHDPARPGIRIGDHPKVLGDVFAWNKAYRMSFWESAGLAWPVGVRYEDQPTLTKAFLKADSFDVLPDIVYHWRIRTDGTSITQQRSTVEDLTDRHRTKRMSLELVQDHVAAGGDQQVLDSFLDITLPGDLRRYFVEIPGCSDEWWDGLVAMVRDLWRDRSLAATRMPPRQRIVGNLVEQGLRDQAVAVCTYLSRNVAPLPRTPDGTAIRLPDLGISDIDPRALVI